MKNKKIIYLTTKEFAKFKGTTVAAIKEIRYTDKRDGKEPKYKYIKKEGRIYYIKP